MALHLYGTPGQSCFDFMWDILIRKAHAYILLVAAHRPKEFRQARQILNFMNERVQIPMIIGLTHTDYPEAWTEEDVFLALGYVDENQRPPIVKVNATERESVVQTVIVLLEHLMANCVV
jgi:signal recognition particle receptor subunit beta